MTLCSAELYRARDHSLRLLYSLSTEPHGNSPFIENWGTQENSNRWPLPLEGGQRFSLSLKINDVY